MDYKFPDQLFPHFYVDEPPKLKWEHDYGGRGSYERLLNTNREPYKTGVSGESPHQFYPQHKLDGEIWVPTEPIVTPLMPPSKGSKDFWDQPARSGEFCDHMQHYYVEHCTDAFSVMGRLLGEHFTFSEEQHHKDSVNMGDMKNFVQNLNKKKCEVRHSFQSNYYHQLLGDIIPDIPSSLLGELLHEELLHQEKLEYFEPATTGGAFACLPSIACPNEAFLIYPSGECLSKLNFCPMELEFSKDKPPVVSVAKRPLCFHLGGAVRQVSVAQVADEAFIGFRSDYFCGVCLLKCTRRPCPQEVVQLKERATSLNVSPHVPGQLVVAGESGAAYLWVLEKGLQKIRDQKTNMYFNSKSSWRWCEFTAHPYTTVFADRTGAELTDIRSKKCHTLFRIGGTANCKSYERVVLSKYLSQSHTFHHLITTQFSAYLMDERMPCVPVLKWEHMMKTPPCFAHALGNGNTSKILLGAQTEQETMLLQYSGGRESACQADGKIQKLYSPCESLKTRMLPDKHHKAKMILASRAAGLSAVQNNGWLCVFQLTETGDIFYQVLRQFDPTDSQPHQSAEPAANTKSAIQPQDSLEEDGLLQREHNQIMLASDSDDEDLSCTLSVDGKSTLAKKGINLEDALVLDSFMPSAIDDCAHVQKPAVPKMASCQLKLIWKEWLKSLFKSSKESKCYWKHWEIPTSDIKFNVEQQDKLAEDKLKRLRKDLGCISKNRELLVHGATYLPPLALTPVPDEVNPDEWPDDLSQRLSASWKDGWSSWWNDKLGLNQCTKIQALRSKHLRAKRAKAKNRLMLSSSFTSSISYQDDLLEWTSTTSQYLSSDIESICDSQNAPEHDESSDQDIAAENTDFWSGTQNTEEYSGPSTTSLKSEKNEETISEQDEVIGTSKSITMDVQQPSQETWENNSMLFSSSVTSLRETHSIHPKLKPRQQQNFDTSSFGSPQRLGHSNEVVASVPGSRTSLQSSRLCTQSQTSLKTSSQASQPQKKKSRMGF